MEFMKIQEQRLIVQNLFNQEHARELILSVKSQFNEILFKNVGVKIMQLILRYFQEAPIGKVIVDYNWNTIMTTPQLVCYDKNQWKTLQQLNNWNREWKELFSTSFSLRRVELNIQCSWMDDQFAKNVLEGIASLPNISSVSAKLGSKNKKVEEIIEAFAKANIFKSYDYKFIQK